MKLWTFLTTDIRELNLSRVEAVTATGIDAANAVLDLSKALDEQGSKIEALRPYVSEISSLLDVLNSPLTEVIKNTIPFAPLAISILKLVADTTKKEPTLEQCMMLVSQAAYLDSMRSLLAPYLKQLEKKEQKKASEAIARQLKGLGKKEFSDQDAKDALLNFPNSKLAQEFNKILKARLQEIGIPEATASNLSSRIAWNTPRHINEALAKHAETLKPLAELHRNGGREALERYNSIDVYLNEKIKPCPKEKVFAESFTFQDIYVPLKGKFIKSDGEVDEDKTSIDLAQWATKTLNDEQLKDKVLFIQGGPGRGKSVFCRMFADWVRRVEYPRWIPILIRLRDIRVLEKDFEETLKKAVDRDFAKNDSGWLTDRNVRFLFLLDGFDELLMQGRTSGGLEEFLNQVGRFQESCKENSEKGHKILITGRTLSLQSIERQMPSNLKRVEILPMDKTLQEKWFEKWQNLVGIPKAKAFQIFLKDPRCPERIRGSKRESGLAQEPLLLYLLAAMHRDETLTLEMFDGAERAKAKILIYEQSLTWVLTKQRPEWLNRDLTEFETESLRRILAEAGLCVAQTGRECAPIAMIEERLKGDDGARNLLETARIRLEDNPLRNALAAFYLQPGRGGSGSVEFAHKSFSEFLCAERLKEALEDWTRPSEKKWEEFSIDIKKLHWQIYDLLGQPILTQEIVEYLRALLFDSLAFQPIALFKRLNDFYERWCEGEFIDAPIGENLPQEKSSKLKDLPINAGLRQVDVYSGLNAMILLLELHRYAQSKEELQDKIFFYPSGQLPEESNEPDCADRLLKVIHYSDSVSRATFTRTVGAFLIGSNLSRADLDRVNLSNADLSDADLNNAYLTSVNLAHATLFYTNLSNANLTGANFFRANLARANLTKADLTNANLFSADLTSANLTNANLFGADLTNATLFSANFNKANLNQTNLTNAKLFDADLSDASLSSSNLNDTDLSRATLLNTDLSSANLDSANLDSADLSSVNLSNAKLYNVNLYRADLSKANLESADLSGATLVSTNLQSANLTNACLLDSDLENISWNEETIWDEVRGLETARNVPEALKQQLGLQETEL